MRGSPKLLNRDFLLIWQGQIWAHGGAQLFAIAAIFWMKHQTGSALMVAVLTAFATLPSIVLGPLAGAAVDRYSRRRIMVFSGAVGAVAALALAVAMHRGDAPGWALVGCVLATTLLIGAANAFYTLATNAAVPDLVPVRRLGGANSLVQGGVQLAELAGQALGGIGLRVLGAPLLCLATAATQGIFSAAALGASVPQVVPPRAGAWKATAGRWAADLRQGFAFVRQSAGLRMFVLASAASFFLFAPVILLLPFYVEDVLGAPADWYGLILAVFGGGALLGYAGAGAVRPSPGVRATLVIGALLLQGAGIIALGVTRDGRIALLTVLPFGVATGFLMVHITTALQLTTPGEMRGRVLALATALNHGLRALGALAGGLLADLTHRDVPLLYVSCGLSLVLLALVLFASSELRSFLAYHDQAAPVQPARPRRTTEPPAAVSTDGSSVTARRSAGRIA